MIPACRLMSSNTKKNRLKRDRRNMRWINASHSLHPQLRLVSSSCQEAAIKLGLIHDRNNQNQHSISQLVEFPEHRVVEECATPMVCTERQLIQKFSFQPVDLQEPYIALIDMGKIIRHNPYKWSDYHLSFFVTTMLLISSVLMTPMTQPTPLKMTNKTYEYRVGLMSPIST